MLFNYIHPIDFDVFTFGMQSNAKHEQIEFALATFFTIIWGLKGDFVLNGISRGLLISLSEAYNRRHMKST